MNIENMSLLQDLPVHYTVSFSRCAVYMKNQPLAEKITMEYIEHW